MSSSPELVNFLHLDPAQQLQAIEGLAAEGWSAYGIAGATRLSVEQVRRLLGDPLKYCHGL